MTIRLGPMLRGCALSAILGAVPVATFAQDAQIWSYWSTGSEGAALTALLEANAAAHPDLPVGSRVISGNSTEIRRAMQVAFLGGNPPAVYQSAIAQDLKAFRDADRIADIQDVIGDVEGVADMASGIKRVVSFDGDLYGVPLNIHLISNVFYNKKIFDELGITPPATAEEFRAAADKIRAAGYEVLGNASGPSWTFYTLFPFLYAELGQEDLFAFGSGEITFTDARVKAAFQSWTDTYVANFMPDWTGYTWADTAEQFAQGKVAMYEMGDWLSAYLTDAGWTFDEQYGVFPAPGLDGAVVAQLDVLAKPSGLDDATDAAADALLQTAAGPEGQLAFNVKKGSVAPNPAAGSEGYTPYGVAAYEQIQAATQADKVIPNPKFLLPTELNEEIGNDIVAYAQAPSPDALDAMLEKLDGLREDLVGTDAFIKW